MSEFASEREVTARTLHQCGECFRTIQPGERYQRAAGSWEGEFWSMTTCAHCAAIRPLVAEEDPWYQEHYYGGLWESLNNLDRYPLPLLRVMVNMRRHWSRRDGTLVDVP